MLKEPAVSGLGFLTLAYKRLFLPVILQIIFIIFLSSQKTIAISTDAPEKKLSLFLSTVGKTTSTFENGFFSFIFFSMWCKDSNKWPTIQTHFFLAEKLYHNFFKPFFFFFFEVAVVAIWNKTFGGETHKNQVDTVKYRSI